MGVTYKLIELVGTSPQSFAEAAKAAVAEASKTVCRASKWGEWPQCLIHSSSFSRGMRSRMVLTCR